MTEPVTPTLIPALSTLFPDAGDLDTFDARAAALFNYLVSTMAPGANILAEQAHTNALAAMEAVVLAYLNANFKGAWSGLTGALTMPALVSHAGERWVLLNNLADVTASEPGVSADWELFELPAATGVGFDPTGTSRTATNVQDVLEDISEDADTALVEFENPVLNGDMRIAQTGVSFACAAGITYVLDGWLCAIGGAAVMTVSQSSAATPDNASAKWLIATVTTPDATMAATDYAYLAQRIEGYEIARYVNSTFTLGFWVKSSVTGLHGISLRGGTVSYSYIGTVNILAANTPQFVTLTVTGGLPSAAAWEVSNGSSLTLSLVMACGTNLQDAAGSWIAGNKIATASQVNAVATASNVFGITDVQINPGTIAKRFKRPTYQASLARCKRYYAKTSVHFTGYGLAGQTATYTFDFPETLRTTVVPSVAATNNTNCSSLSANYLLNNVNVGLFSLVVNTTGTYQAAADITLDARL